MRGHHQLAPSVNQASDVGLGHHRSGADQGAITEAFHQDLDAVERLRRVQRHLDDLDARLDQHRADGLHLARFDAAQYRNQRGADENRV